MSLSADGFLGLSTALVKWVEMAVTCPFLLACGPLAMPALFLAPVCVTIIALQILLLYLLPFYRLYFDLQN